MIEAAVSVEAVHQEYRTYMYSACGHGEHDTCVALTATEGAVGAYLQSLAEEYPTDLQVAITAGDGRICIDTRVSWLAWLEVQDGVKAAYNILRAGATQVAHGIGGVEIDDDDIRPKDMISWRIDRRMNGRTMQVVPLVPVVLLSEKRPT